jgi:hypothetical protein
MSVLAMPYISPSHTCLGHDPLQLMSYLSQNHPLSLAGAVAITKESIDHRQLIAPGVETQPESEKGLQLERFSVVKAECPIQPTKDAFQSSQKRSQRNIDIPFQKSILRIRERFDFRRPTTNSSVLIDHACAQSRKIPPIESSRCIVERGNPLLTKNSGEHVKAALRSSNGTVETRLCKFVHFHSQLEHTISFFRDDVPLAIGTDLTLVDQDESPFEWEASFSNFPAENPHRSLLPVRVESAFMSLDNTEVIGSIAVANIAFHKVVSARYTLDYWKTASDVVAEFSSDAHPGNNPGRYDYFNFKIKITDRANLGLKVLSLAAKYCVNGQEYWDNNNFANFQIRFNKTPSPGPIRVVSPPRSNLRPKRAKELAASTYSKPQSIPPAFENFANATGVHESDKLKQLVNDRLSGSKSERTLEGHGGIGLEYPTPIVLKRSAQPFRSRYNFDSSLSAAIHGTNSTPAGCASLVRKTIVNTERQSARCLPDAPDSASLLSTTNFLNTNKAALPSSTRDRATSSIALAPTRPYQALPSGAEKSVLSSDTYNKMLEIYCFVRTTYMIFHSYHQQHFV